MRLFRIAVIVAAAVAVAGCTVQYTYNGATYAIREEALAAHRKDLNEALDGIVPVQNPLGGAATVVIPSMPALLSRGVVRTGRAGAMQDDAASFVAETLLVALEGNADALRRGRVFSSVTVVKVDNPAETAKTAGGDTVIWLDLVDPNTAQWYGFDRDGKIVAVPVDTGAPLGAPRLQKWVNLVSEALAGMSQSNPPKASAPAGKQT